MGRSPTRVSLQNAPVYDAIIREQQVWLAQNYCGAELVSALVKRCGIPERSFARRFRAATGYSPIEYIQALRVEEAKQMLETSDSTVEDIGREVGYQDPGIVPAVVQAARGISPADYRGAAASAEASLARRIRRRG